MTALSTSLQEKLTANALRTAHLTDSGNAERLVTLHAEKLRYVHDAKRWHVWDGVSWAPDRTGEAARLARETATATLRAAASWSEGVDDKTRAALVKHALSSENAPKLDAALKVAQSHAGLAALIEDFDIDPWSLNVANGIVDLKTGELRPHDPAEMHSKVANASLRPDASCPQWLEFLERVLTDPEVREFVQKLCGYSLGGNIGENVLPFAWGTGANGKSVFFSTLRHVFGDYGAESPPDLLMEKFGDQHPTAIADLQGNRFVTAQEVNPGKRMDAGLMKHITGDETLKARRMRQDFYEFTNVTTMWLAANDKPEVEASDDAIWRRIVLLPFSVTIPAGERNPDLAAKLKAEADGILKWMVDGAVLYQRDGLARPDAVKLATDEYRDESNPLAEWVEAQCELRPQDPATKTANVELRDAYEKWCQRFRRDKIKRGRGWKDGLSRLGCSEVADSAHSWAGIRLRPQVSEMDM